MAIIVSDMYFSMNLISVYDLIYKLFYHMFNWELDESVLCQMGPLQICPIKSLPGANQPPSIRPWANRSPIKKNFCNWNLFIDLQKAFNWADIDISSGYIRGHFRQRLP